FFLIIIFGFIKNWKILFAVFCFLIFMGGGYYIQESFIEPNNPYGKDITFSGVVVKEPDVRADHVRLVLKSEQLEGLVQVKNKKYPEYDYGDFLEVSCQLKKPEKIEDFSYDLYLARFNIYSLCYRPEIKLIEKNQGNIFLGSIFKFKKKLMQSLEYVYPAPVSQVMAGILLGMKKGLPEELNQYFIDTGTIHIMVVSGFNVMIVSMVVVSLFKGIGIPRKKLFYFLAGFIFVFVILTGAESSVVRAMIMALAVHLGEKVGRPRNPLNVLVLTATVMVAMNPKILVFDAGFQLSFLATIALVYLAGHMQKLLKFEVVATTLACIIFTSPLVMFQFGRISLVALIANIVIVPFISPLTIFGLANLGIGLIFPKLAFYLGSLGWLIGEGIIKVAGFFAEWKYASLEVPEFHWGWLFGAYGFLFLVIYFLNRSSNKSGLNQKKTGVNKVVNLNPE
ncbi:ComEC family competence protein, partial [Patescibacteria group bacterium]|nr:ComEC family competence protein [Patescibacteria group bacterium]MBU1963699.1 ComEC family competence protein [Patescibacteria group bacterium]